MKTLLTLLALVSLPGSLLLHAAPGGKGTVKMRDAATHDQLSSRLRMAQQKDPIRNIGPPIGKTEEDPSLRNSSRDLIKDSIVISYRGNLTLVPKRAVLHLPEELSDRIGVKDGLQVKNWRDFYQVNRGWIRTMEVTRDQALGHAPFNEEVTEAIKTSSSLVVATYKGGPISVLPLKKPEDPSDEGQSPSDSNEK